MYIAFKDDDGNEYGSCEVFHLDADTIAREGMTHGDGADEEPMAPGWYWWACFPGCMPNGEPNGPFDTEQEAIDDAQEN